VASPLSVFCCAIPFYSKEPVNRSHSGQVPQVARQPIAATTIIYFYLVGCSCNALRVLSQVVILLAVHPPYVRAAAVSFQPASFNRSSSVPLHHAHCYAVCFSAWHPAAKHNLN